MRGTLSAGLIAAVFAVTLQTQTPPAPSKVEGFEAASIRVTRQSTIGDGRQDQLGLKLEPTRAPVDVLVVDRVEPPTEN